MQFDAGPYIGCIPDGYSFETQEPISWKVNPAALVSLRRLLDTSHDNFSIAADRNIRVASPFPIRFNRDGVILDNVPFGVNYQILINGSQVMNLQGSGARDVIPLK
jgi:hypothetical protein